MHWVSAVLVGFPALTALVIALGRDATSRWERETGPAAPRSSEELLAGARARR